ncbi:MAG: hypothetical protein ACRC57_11860 [Sarcina sp.]
MKNLELNEKNHKVDSKIHDEEKIKEIQDFVHHREKEIFDFFKDKNVLEKDKHDLENNMMDAKFLIILEYNTENQKLYNCFDTREGAIKAFEKIQSINKVIAKGIIEYNMILGAMFITSYEIKEIININ